MTAAAGLESLGRVLDQEAARRGVDRAAQVVVVADGAPWVRNLVAEHFRAAIQTVERSATTMPFPRSPRWRP